jgi:hypothetical protein
MEAITATAVDMATLACQSFNAALLSDRSERIARAHAQSNLHRVLPDDFRELRHQSTYAPHAAHSAATTNKASPYARPATAAHFGIDTSIGCGLGAHSLVGRVYSCSRCRVATTRDQRRICEVFACAHEHTHVPA